MSGTQSGIGTSVQKGMKIADPGTATATATATVIARLVLETLAKQTELIQGVLTLSSYRQH